MILTDVYVPQLNEAFDFRLDEHAPIKMLIPEILEILQNKSGSKATYSLSRFVLCSMEKGEILEENRTLQDYGVKNGSRLLMV